MIPWALHHLFVWSVRLGVLVAACVTIQRILHDDLEYRVEFKPLFIVALLTIVTVRLWMPWVPPKRTKEQNVE